MARYNMDPILVRYYSQMAFRYNMERRGPRYYSALKQPHMTRQSSTRAGEYVAQPGGYRAFLPKPLPPDPPLRLDDQAQVLLSEADRAIGRLDAATELLPNPHLFVMMYVRKEAVDSSRIEGTQASLTDLVEYESRLRRKGMPDDVAEVANYVLAMNHGLSRLAEIPVSNRLIREIHSRLLQGVRGAEKRRGEFRVTQNWIGGRGSIDEAAFVPPPPTEVTPAMSSLEKFLHDEAPLQPLIKCGLAHAQFETIHPFLDGNGRAGRLLITLLLCWKGVLKRPLLYLSDYFKTHRTEYYERLQAVRDEGDWEGWLRFFLEGVRSVSMEATNTAKLIQTMREEHRAVIVRELPVTGAGLVLLDGLFERPIVTIADAARMIDRTYATANSLVAAFESRGLLKETTGQSRNRVYRYEPYLSLFEQLQ